MIQIFSLIQMEKCILLIGNSVETENGVTGWLKLADYTYEEALETIKIYLSHEPSQSELRHYLGYIAIASYYWYVWAIYQESLGNPVGEYLYIWYKNSKFYAKKALELYK